MECTHSRDERLGVAAFDGRGECLDGGLRCVEGRLRRLRTGQVPNISLATVKPSDHLFGSEQLRIGWMTLTSTSSRSSSPA